MEVEEERGAAKVQLKELNQERDQLRGKVQEQNNKVDQLSLMIQDCKTTERLLEQRAKQLEVRKNTQDYDRFFFECGLSVCTHVSLVLKREKQQLEEALRDVRRNEEEMCQSNQSLLSRLEEVQVNQALRNSSKML